MKKTAFISVLVLLLGIFAGCTDRRGNTTAPTVPATKPTAPVATTIPEPTSTEAMTTDSTASTDGSAVTEETTVPAVTGDARRFRR